MGHLKYIENIKSDLHNFDLWLLLFPSYLRNPLISPPHSHIPAPTSSTQAIIKHWLKEEGSRRRMLTYWCYSLSWHSLDGEGRISDRWNRILQGYSCRHPRARKATFRGRSHDASGHYSLVGYWLSMSLYWYWKSNLIPTYYLSALMMLLYSQ